MIARLIATFGGIGLLKPAPGTWGSLAALPAAWIIAQTTGFWGMLAATLVVTLGGIAAIQRYAGQEANIDKPEIVIDEVAGQWIALLPVIYGASHAGVDLLKLYPGWIAAFVLFRLFDIWKPGPVGWADRRKDALGVMLDDLIAGMMAAVGVGILAALAHAI